MPNLTTKELNVLEEQLGAEQVVIKKYHAMSGQCTDPALKKCLENIAQRHQQHFDKLVGYLK